MTNSVYLHIYVETQPSTLEPYNVLGGALTLLHILHSTYLRVVFDDKVLQTMGVHYGRNGAWNCKRNVMDGMLYINAKLVDLQQHNIIYGSELPSSSSSLFGTSCWF